MHISLDVDDVIVDFIGGVLDAIAIETGIRVDKEELAGWDVTEQLDPILGENWWGWLERRSWLWGGVFGAIPGAINGIERLKRAGHFVEAVTSKPDWAAAEVWRWFGRWRPAISSVTIVPMKMPKVAYTRGQVLVDDKPENVEHWLEQKRDAAILFDQPWNRGEEAQHALELGAFRANNWRDVLRAIENLDTGRL